jgi:hypothetical protein
MKIIINNTNLFSGYYKRRLKTKDIYTTKNYDHKTKTVP